MPSTFSAIFPPAPTFTESSVPDLSSKVHIVTGAASGVGYETARILYQKGGVVYIAARSNARCNEAIERIKAQTSGIKTTGRLEALVLDLTDLASVKTAAQEFLEKESRLDLLIHNAGVMTPPKGSKTKDGYDLEMATNCLGPYLFTVLLEPILRRTALSVTPRKFGSVRIVWVVSLLQLGSPKNGMDFDATGTPIIRGNAMENYMQTKVGGAWLANEFAERLGGDGIISVSVHPGLMRTELQRNFPWIGRAIMKVIFKPPVYGAYSELYSSFSPDLTEKHNGGYIMAWGRIAAVPAEVSKGIKSVAEGGSGRAKKFVEYLDREIASYLK
ncbi:putative short-chain dehydrogenase [Xylogone sp. PMI_703]|nr:putative short-chain dehydrogenase [Xylogone sp. PMI_703]